MNLGKVSGREWKRRAEQMLADNLRLQQFGQQVLKDWREVFDDISKFQEKNRLLIMYPGKELLSKVKWVASAYLDDVPDMKVAPNTEENRKHLERLKAMGKLKEEKPSGV
jgi:hypothetical protein